MDRRHFRVPRPSRRGPAVLLLVVLIASRPADAPAAGAAPPLEPDDVVREVLERNPSLEAMRAARIAATERIPQAGALEDPRFSYRLAPASIGDRRLDPGQTFEISQDLPWPGTLAARREVARHEAQAAGDELEATRLDLETEARLAFYDWWEAHVALRINATDLQLLAELRAIAEARYTAGLVSRADALQAAVEHHHLGHREETLHRRRAVVQARINALRNLPPGAPLAPPVAELPPPPPVPALDELLAPALERRPALRAGRSVVRAREADVHRTRLELRPSFSAMAAYDGLWEVEELRPILGFAITVPIQRERRRAAVAEARARLSASRARLAQDEANVRLELETALERLLEETRIFALYRSSIVPAAEEAVGAARAGYEAATNDFGTLIEAERALSRARLAQAKALASSHRAQARLERATAVRREHEVMP